MYKKIAISTLFLAAAMAVPTVVERDGVSNPNTAFCGTSVTYSQFQCCDVNVLPGVLAVGCQAPSDWPEEDDTPQSICDASGHGHGHPKCCTVDLLGLGVLCQDINYSG